MNRPYQFYYFVPLITFWFVIMFVTFKIIPHVTTDSADGLSLPLICYPCQRLMIPLLYHFTANSSHYFYIILKLITLFGVVTLLYTSEVFFENIFLIRPWKALFVTTDDSIQEWWFRFKIDRYVSFICFTFVTYHQLTNNRTVFSMAECSLWHGLCI